MLLVGLITDIESLGIMRHSTRFGLRTLGESPNANLSVWMITTPLRNGVIERFISMKHDVGFPCSPLGLSLGTPIWKCSYVQDRFLG